MCKRLKSAKKQNLQFFSANVYIVGVISEFGIHCSLTLNKFRYIQLLSDWCFWPFSCYYTWM